MIGFRNGEVNEGPPEDFASEARAQVSAPGQFQVGDRVRVVGTDSRSVPRNHDVGRMGTVARTWKTGPLRVEVSLDVSEHESPRVIPMSELELEHVEHANPDDPTSMALPVIGDTVLLGDGFIGSVTGRMRRRINPDVWRIESDGITRWVSIDEIAGFPEESSGAPDHGPLAASLSDRTLDKVLSRPAHVPSLVVLDAAEHLAEVVSDYLSHGHGMPGSDVLRQALANFRQAVAR